MLHFTCDLCGRQLGDQRFVAKMEVFPAYDPDELDEDDLDADHLQEVSQMIEEMELNGDSELEQCSKTFRFDFCPDCQQKFLKDPLGRESNRRLNFSEN